MRVIKFRGKCIDETTDNGKWIVGSLLQDDNGIFMIVCFVDHHEQWYRVDPDTVGQFTGIKDKNYREIYEHDLIECGRILCEVVFNSHTGSFSLLEVFTQQLGSQPLGVMLDMFHASLKGNIHDNPELLKGDSNGSH